VEIRLQPKRRRRGWFWLVVLIAPFAYLAYWSREHRTASAGEVVDVDSTASFIIPRDTLRGPDRVAELAEFLQRADTSADERRQREFLANAFALLGNAVGSMRGADAPFAAGGVATMRRYAESLRSPRGRVSAQSDSVRATLLLAADAIDSVQKSAYPSSSGVVAPVRKAAQAIQPGQAIVSQRQPIITFFKEASSALQGMRARRE
jgi:hypothetical protein